MSPQSSSNTLSESQFPFHTKVPFQEGREDPDVETPDGMKREPGETGELELEARQQCPVTAGQPKKYSHDCK
jgi:hypothetical protein